MKTYRIEFVDTYDRKCVKYVKGNIKKIYVSREMNDVKIQLKNNENLTIPKIKKVILVERVS